MCTLVYVTTTIVSALQVVTTRNNPETALCLFNTKLVLSPIAHSLIHSVYLMLLLPPPKSFRISFPNAEKNPGTPRNGGIGRVAVFPAAVLAACCSTSLMAAFIWSTPTFLASSMVLCVRNAIRWNVRELASPLTITSCV